eukprot:Lithocolla_globosa_v1_NODE_1766_length_2353_cov_87.258921.p2 type:complete len:143 gc:universal NODE_1766_length_2353_cov_87.258921:383-811(+)
MIKSCSVSYLSYLASKSDVVMEAPVWVKFKEFFKNRSGFLSSESPLKKNVPRIISFGLCTTVLFSSTLAVVLIRSFPTTVAGRRFFGSSTPGSSAARDCLYTNSRPPLVLLRQPITVVIDWLAHFKTFSMLKLFTVGITWWI